jgi:hypothetical protein
MGKRGANISIIITIIAMVVITTGSACYGIELFIYGCVKDNGVLRIVDHPYQCKASEKIISFLPMSANLYSKGCTDSYVCSCNEGDVLLSGGAACGDSAYHLVRSFASSWPSPGEWWADCATSENVQVKPQSIHIVCMTPGF